MADAAAANTQPAQPPPALTELVAAAVSVLIKLQVMRDLAVAWVEKNRTARARFLVQDTAAPSLLVRAAARLEKALSLPLRTVTTRSVDGVDHLSVVVDGVPIDPQRELHKGQLLSDALDETLSSEQRKSALHELEVLSMEDVERNTMRGLEVAGYTLLLIETMGGSEAVAARISAGLAGSRVLGRRALAWLTTAGVAAGATVLRKPLAGALSVLAIALGLRGASKVLGLSVGTLLFGVVALLLLLRKA